MENILTHFQLFLYQVFNCSELTTHFKAIEHFYYIKYLQLVKFGAGTFSTHWSALVSIHTCGTCACVCYFH